MNGPEQAVETANPLTTSSSTHKPSSVIAWPVASHPPSRHTAFHWIVHIFVLLCIMVGMLYPVCYTIHFEYEVYGRYWPFIVFFLMFPAHFLLLGAIWYFRICNKWSHSSARPPQPWYERIRAGLWSASTDWTYDLFQALVSLATSLSYIIYTYSVTVKQAPAPYNYVYYTVDHGPYDATNPGAASLSIVEFTLSVTLMLDLAVRSLCAPDLKHFLLSYYTFIDFAAFFSTAYYFVLVAQMQISLHSDFDVLLATGAFRMLRVRNVLKSLDAQVQLRINGRNNTISNATDVSDNVVVTSASTLPEEKGGYAVTVPVQSDNTHNNSGMLLTLGPFKLHAKVVGFTLLAVRIVLFLLCATSIMLTLEFPCEFINGPSLSSLCHVEYQEFHLTLYFIIVTFSTVGYGDVFPGTPGGRMVLALLILIMLVQVPIQINAVMAYFDQDTRLDDVLNEVRELKSQLSHAHAISSPTSLTVTNKRSLTTTTSPVLSNALLRHCGTGNVRTIASSIGVTMSGGMSDEDVAAAIVTRLFGSQWRERDLTE